MNLEDKLLEKLEQINDSIKSLDSKLESSINNLDSKIDRGIKGLDSKIDSGLKGLNIKFEKEIKRVDERLEIIEVQQKESINILKALEHSAEVNKAEHDSMQHDISEIKGEIKGIREDLTAVEPYISH
jgi:DNA repair exonuclease SbcCD ATPase subunit